MIDPRVRQRVAVTSTPEAIEAGLSNGELLERFAQATKGSLKILPQYVGCLQDAIRYFRDHQTGQEVPVRLWTKKALWAYLEYVQNNYCAHFIPLGFQKKSTDPVAACILRVWSGSMPAAKAVQVHCLSCPSFRSPTVRHRIKALCKWFSWLSHVEAVRYNIMTDVRNGWHEYHVREDETGQASRRNPTLAEEQALVNGTLHPQRRAFYALGAKNWYRPNEMFMLHRYASFGIPLPLGMQAPQGFASGHSGHPELKGFQEGGELIYLPETKGRFDKRKGNRWGVVDTELRPILEQHFAWWDRHVKRTMEGVPVHGCM